MKQLKPGVSWLEMHRVAEREVLKGLIGCGVLTDLGKDLDEVVDEMMEVSLGGIFMPHVSRISIVY